MSNPQRSHAALKAALSTHSEDMQDAVLALLLNLEHHCKAHHINLKQAQWHATWAYHNERPAWLDEIHEPNPLYRLRKAG